MRIARALAASALALSLTASVAPAQAAPQPAPAVAQVTAPAASTPALAKTKITIKASAKKVKLGTTVRYTGKLTRETANGYRPFAKQKVLLVLFDDGKPVLATARTSASGTYTLKLKIEKWMVGGTLELCAFAHETPKSELAWTGWFPLKVTEK